MLVFELFASSDMEAFAEFTGIYLIKLGRSPPADKNTQSDGGEFPFGVPHLALAGFASYPSPARHHASLFSAISRSISSRFSST
jgi:hypothetical protein